MMGPGRVEVLQREASFDLFTERAAEVLLQGRKLFRRPSRQQSAPLVVQLQSIPTSRQEYVFVMMVFSAFKSKTKWANNGWGPDAV